MLCQQRLIHCTTLGCLQEAMLVTPAKALYQQFAVSETSTAAFRATTWFTWIQQLRKKGTTICSSQVTPIIAFHIWDPTIVIQNPKTVLINAQTAAASKQCPLLLLHQETSLTSTGIVLTCRPFIWERSYKWSNTEVTASQEGQGHSPPVTTLLHYDCRTQGVNDNFGIYSLCPGYWLFRGVVTANSSRSLWTTLLAHGVIFDAVLCRDRSWT